MNKKCYKNSQNYLKLKHFPGWQHIKWVAFLFWKICDTILGLVFTSINSPINIEMKPYLKSLHHTELFSSSASWNFMQSRRGRDLCYLIEGVAKHMVSLSIKHKQTTIQDAKDCPNYWNKRKSLYFVTRKTLYFCKDYFNGDLTSGTKYLDWLKKSLIKSEKKVVAMRKSQRVAENISFPFELVILKQTFMKLIIWQTLTKLKMLTMEELWYSF